MHYKVELTIKGDRKGESEHLFLVFLSSCFEFSTQHRRWPFEPVSHNEKKHLLFLITMECYEGPHWQWQRPWHQQEKGDWYEKEVFLIFSVLPYFSSVCNKLFVVLKWWSREKCVCHFLILFSLPLFVLWHVSHILSCVSDTLVDIGLLCCALFLLVVVAVSQAYLERREVFAKCCVLSIGKKNILCCWSSLPFYQLGFFSNK